MLAKRVRLSVVVYLCCLCGAVCSGVDNGKPNTRVWVSWLARDSYTRHVDLMVDIVHVLDRKLLDYCENNVCAFYGKFRFYALIYLLPVPVSTSTAY